MSVKQGYRIEEIKALDEIIGGNLSIKPDRRRKSEYQLRLSEEMKYQAKLSEEIWVAYKDTEWRK